MGLLKNIILVSLVWFNFFVCCYASDVPPGCEVKTQVCVSPGGTKYFQGVPVYQPCWKYNITYSCPNWGQISNSCSSYLNCIPNGNPSTKTPWTKVQPMVCKKSQVSYVCTKYKTSKNCQNKFTYDDGYKNFTTTPTKSFSNAMGQMGVLDQMAKNVSVNPLSIFEGNSRICKRPDKLGPLTTNCCDEELHTHGKKWSVNKCSLNEIKLATGRRSLRTHYIGSWCAHHLPWPFEHVCTEHKQGYCEFGSMLGRIFQEQGREQIDNIAINGNGHAITQNFQWNFSSSGSHWNRTQINGVSVASYTWQSITPKITPIYIATTTPFLVKSGTTSSLGSLFISMSCKNGVCSGQMQNNLSSKVPYSMNPTCTTPYSWSIGSMGIEQGICLKEGQQPDNWPSISWKGNTPNIWQFKVLNDYQNTINNGVFSTVLPNKDKISATGGCISENCNFNVLVKSLHQTLSGKLRFPINCKSDDQYTLTLGDISISPKCNLPNEVFAICTNGNNCGVLPPNPTSEIGNVVNHWKFFETGIDQGAFKFLTKNIAVKGGCQNNLCQWTFASLGQSGNTVTLNASISWNLFDAPMVNNVVKPGYPNNGMITPVNINLKPYMYAPGNDITQGFSMQYQLPSSKSWLAFPNLIPLNVSESNPIVLNQSPLVKMFGHCDSTTGNCNFNIISQVKVLAMPWGSAQNPQCEGFTPSDMLLINPSKMDLSAWTNHIASSFGPGEQKQLSNFAKNSINNFYGAMNGGGSVSSPTPNRSGYSVMKVSPKEGQGPFSASLVATAYWPKYIPYGQCGYPETGNQNPKVNQLNINWGDGISQTISGSSTEILQETGSNYNNSGNCVYAIPVFKVTHQFPKPPGHNVIENVSGSFQVGERLHKAIFKVDNFWNTPNEFNGVGGGITNPDPNLIKPNQMPGNGDFNPKNIPGTPTGNMKRGNINV